MAAVYRAKYVTGIKKARIVCRAHKFFGMAAVYRAKYVTGIKKARIVCRALTEPGGIDSLSFFVALQIYDK